MSEVTLCPPGLDPIVFGPRGPLMRCFVCDEQIRPSSARPGDIWQHIYVSNHRAIPSGRFW